MPAAYKALNSSNPAGSSGGPEQQEGLIGNVGGQAAQNNREMLSSQFEDNQSNPILNLNNILPSTTGLDGTPHQQQIGSSLLTPPRRNNEDSRKTSGANTPNKEGADTPTTHQSYRGNMHIYPGAQRSQAGLTDGPVEFGSAVTAGLNQHLNNLNQTP